MVYLLTLTHHQFEIKYIKRKVKPQTTRDLYFTIKFRITIHNSTSEYQCVVHHANAFLFFYNCFVHALPVRGYLSNVKGHLEHSFSLHIAECSYTGCHLAYKFHLHIHIAAGLYVGSFSRAWFGLQETWYYVIKTKVVFTFYCFSFFFLN